MRQALPILSSLLMLIAALIPAPHAIAQPTDDAPSDSQNDPQPEFTTLHQRSDRLIVELPNRMIFIAQRVPAAPVASAQVWVETGSIYEQQHNGAGLSHFLEHLVSGGTTSNRTEQESNAVLGRIGASTNAATSLDTVRYYINTTADHADTAIDLLSDWMQNSQIPQNEFEREREVIQREFSMGQGDPGRIFWKLTQQARYETHPARHPTIGYLDEFMQITRDDIYDFYKTMYVPNNMVFVVTGDIEPQTVVDQVASLWEDVPAKELPELSFPEEPAINGPRTLEGRADIQRPRLRLAWPGTRLAGEGDYALDLLGMILGQGETSRLKQSVRDQQQLVTSIDAYNLSFAWGEGFFGVDAEVRTDGEDDDHMGHVHAAVLEQVEMLRNEPVTDAELKRAKRNVLANVLSGNQSTQAVASRLARDTIGMHDPDYLGKYAQRIQSVTAEQLQAAAERFLQDDRLITVKLLPLEGHEPESLARPDAPDNADTLAHRPVRIDNAAKLDDMREHLAEADATSEPIEVDDPVQFTLDNGLRVIVQRSTVVPAVSMQMYWKGGLLAETPGEEGVANAMATMLRRGTEHYTADELAQAVEDLGASLSAGAGNNTTYARGSALSEDWPRVMELLGEIVLRPTFPADEWQRIQPRLLAAIDRQTDSWYGELSRNFRAVYFGDHPWSQTPLGRAEVVRELTPEALRQYHAQRLAAQDAVLAVVGDVEPEAVRARVTEVFGEMPGEAEHPFTTEAPTAADIQVHQAQTQKPVTAAIIAFGPTVDRAHEDYAVLRVLSRVFSNFPSGWLERELRGRQGGLAYAAWAQHITGLVPGYFSVAFNTSADSVAEALNRSMRLVERARAGEISEEDLQRAKAKVLSQEFLGRQSNSDRSMSAALDELYGAGDLEGERFRRTVQQLTVDDVQAAARRYLNDPVAVVMSQQTIDEQALRAALEGEASSAAQSGE